MKKAFKYITIIAAAVFTLSSCIKETLPQGGTVTATQVGASASALEASVNGIPAQMSQGYLIYGEQTSELDMSLPGLFIDLNECLGDMYAVGDAGYDHYSYFNTCKSCGKTTYRSYIPWRTLYLLVKAANDVIGAIDESSASDQQKQYLGMACAYRAYFYWMLMNLYEPVANEYTDCSKVLGLTVPKVTEATTEDEAKNNPRIKHDDMVAFIISDLDKAEECLEGATIKDKLIPSYAVVCGLKARTYLSDGNWAKAEEFAAKAIAAASDCKVLTQAQWEDVNTGFNTANDAWMWKISYSAENMGNLCNWIGWMSGEADWGYGQLTVPGIDAGLYDKIPDTDFRKHSWLDPEKTDYYEYKSCRDSKWFAAAPAYASLKFRPVGGDYKTYSVGGACDVPLMRIEEMYLIQAEAKGMQSLQDGIELLETFVKTRQKDYSCGAANKEAFQKEVFFQKRIEFWGEGLPFFDAKRLKVGCTQSYVGTNAPGDEYKINCNGIKPNWNFVIPESEESSNTAIKDNNNPDPSGTVTPDLRY